MEYAIWYIAIALALGLVIFEIQISFYKKRLKSAEAQGLTKKLLGRKSNKKEFYRIERFESGQSVGYYYSDKPIISDDEYATLTTKDCFMISKELLTEEQYKNLPEFTEWS